MIASRRCTSPAPPSIHSAGAVRPARRQRRAHPLERGAVGPPARAELDAEAAHGLRRPRSSRPRAAAATSASNSRGWRAGRSASRVPLHAQLRAGRRRPRCPRSSRPAPTPPPAGRCPSRSTAWWWKEFTPQLARRRGSRPAASPASTRTVCVSSQPGRGLAVVDRAVGDVGQMLVQRAAARDVERLAPRQMPRIGMPERVGVPRHLELEGVQRGLDRRRGRDAARRRRRPGRGPGRRTGRRRAAARAAARRVARAAAAARPAAPPARSTART